MTATTTQPEFVFVIDNDAATKRQIVELLAAGNVRTRSFDSLVRFLDWLDYDRLPASAVLAADINMPELGGLDLLNILKSDRVFRPTILMGGSLSVRDAVDAMYAGANYILQKPFSDDAFHAAVNRVMQVERAIPTRSGDGGSVERRLSSLSQRQRELLIGVSRGRTNKQIASELSISPKTVELHRAAMMQKMGAGSLAELIRIVVECGDLLQSSACNECA